MWMVEFGKYWVIFEFVELLDDCFFDFLLVVVDVYVE